MKKTRKVSEKTKLSPRSRAFWSGVISFGLVSVPVHLFPATRGRGASLRMLDLDGSPVQRRYYCPKHERDVHPEHIVRGYPIDDEKYVVIRDDELEEVEPEKSREIDLRRFVDRSQVSPALWERGYFLTPGGQSNKAYRLLAEAMESSGRAGIATFVMRGKEYLIVILAENGILRAETLRFPKELRTHEEIGLPEKEPPDERTVAKFSKMIQKYSADKLDEHEMQDDYADRLRELATRQFRSGKEVITLDQHESDEADTEDGEEPIDLLDVIRRSLHGGDGRSPSGNGAHKSRSPRSPGKPLSQKASSNGHTRPPRKSKSHRK